MASRKSESEGPRTLSEAIEHRLGFSLNWTAEQFEESQSTGWSYFGPCVIIDCPGCEKHELHVWKNQASEWGWRLICAGCERRFRYGHLKTNGDRFLGWASREPIPRIPVSCSSDFFDQNLVVENIQQGSPILFESRESISEPVNDPVVDMLVGKGVKRLCHFTPAWRLNSIFEDGLLPHSGLKPGDRIDKYKPEGHIGHVRLTIEYPNLYLLDNFKGKGVGVLGDWELGDWELGDWVVILLDPVIVARPRTQFSNVNAATQSGARIKFGEEGVHAMYQSTVQPPNNKEVTRDDFPNFLRNCPTYLQAEVLVEGKIDVKHFLGIVIEDERARRRIEQLVENHCG